MQNDVFFEDHALLTLTFMVMKYDFFLKTTLYSFWGWWWTRSSTVSSHKCGQWFSECVLTERRLLHYAHGHWLAQFCGHWCTGSTQSLTGTHCSVGTGVQAAHCHWLAHTVLWALVYRQHTVTDLHTVLWALVYRHHTVTDLHTVLWALVYRQHTVTDLHTVLWALVYRQHTVTDLHTVLWALVYRHHTVTDLHTVLWALVYRQHTVTDLHTVLWALVYRQHMTNTAGSGKGAPVCVVMMMMMNVHTALHVYSVEDSWTVEAVNAIPSPLHPPHYQWHHLEYNEGQPMEEDHF